VRCLGFARARGCGGIHVVNLFALRATSPDALQRVADPVGPDNDNHIALAATGRKVVVAWRAHGAYPGREREVMDLLRRHALQVDCLGVTKHGRPRHPLYVRSSANLVSFAG
jgi:hypothetical protein